MDCIFCKIINKDIPSNSVYEDDKIMAFHDLNKEAPVHILIIPKKHISSLNDLQPEDGEVISHIMMKAKDLAKELGVAESGYRLVNNTGSEGGQTVGHLHYHLLGGRHMQWPPG